MPIKPPAEPTKIVGICQVRDEDVFLDWVLTNIVDFCDRIIVADHKSVDQTAAIARSWAARHPKISYVPIAHPPEAHELIRRFANTPTWVFPVDGDEVYDPHGLAKLRPDILTGKYDEYRQFYGHSFHCTEVDREGQVARGYQSPPSRTVTKLYNFGALRDWAGPCTEKCLGGRIVFNDGYSETSNYQIIQSCSWEDSPFRLLHTCFMRRSSRQPANLVARPQVGEIYEVSLLKRLRNLTKTLLGKPPGSAYKLEKYCRGELLETDISSFIVRDAPGSRETA